jgi:Domain of unknown function (DUF4281)
MTPETIFSISNMIAAIGWIILIVAPFWYGSDKFLVGIIITLFAIVYAWLIIVHFNFADAQKFSKLEGVMELFKDPALVTAGWVHYLAFDLMTGIWIRKNSLRHGISPWIVIPCLLFTFMLGPIGLLLYLLIRLVVTKQYFAENY